MAILGKETITVGVENQASGSDSIFAAFNKTSNNFTTLFACSSPYNTFNSGNGISISSYSSNGVVNITNTGVVSLTAGTGITISSTTGEIVISASGDGGMVGVTSVGVISTSLSVSDSPVISAGDIRIELPIIPTGGGFEPGDYITPLLSVDSYGRITSISNTTTSGTVTSVALQALGDGIAIEGGPIIANGTISITNTGVTRINAGTGIEISGSTGNITIGSSIRAIGTVTRVDVTSYTLTVNNSPITESGTIVIEIPDDISLVGNLTAEIVSSNTIANITGNVNAGNLITTGILNSLNGISLGANLSITEMSGTGGPTNELTIIFAVQNGVPFVENAIINISGVTPVGYNGDYTVITGNSNAVVVSSTLSSVVTVLGKIRGGGNLTSNGFITTSANITGANVLANTSVIAPTLKVLGSQTIPAWGTSGTGLIVSSATYTDSTTAGSGTVSSAAVNVINRPTIAASNIAVTATKASTLYVAGAPIAGNNVTLTNSYAVQVAAGIVQIDTSTTSTSTTTGALRVAGGVGVGENLYVGGRANITDTLKVVGESTFGNISSNNTSIMGSLSVSGNVGLDGSNIYISSVSKLNIPGGTSVQVLGTDGTGNLSWKTVTPNGTVGGSNTYVQFNDSGNLGASSTLTFDKATNLLSTTSISVSQTATNAISSGSVVAVKSLLNIQSNFGSNDYQDPASAQGIRGRVTGANLTKTNNYVVGVTGTYNVTGTNASEFPKVGLLGVVGDQTTSADAAIMAYLDGDGGMTTAGAAFKVAMINSTASSGFNYGLDLEMLSTSVPNSTRPYKVADIKLSNGLTVVSSTAAITDGDSTSLPIGSMVLTSNATGVGKMFISNGSILKQLAFATP